MEQHLHLGYYERGYDVEALAFKVVNQELWHVFFPFEQYGIEIPSALKEALHDPDLGTLIFTAPSQEKAQETFTSWVEEEVMPVLEKRQHSAR